MKKRTALISVLVLALTLCFSVFAEESPEMTYAEMHPDVLAFDSYWVSGDGTVRIDSNATEGGFEMLIVEMTGDTAFNSWEYLLTYDEENKRLVADGTGMKSANRFDETGVITDSQYEYEDGTAYFFINENGELCWMDEKESSFEATVFHKIGNFPGIYVCDRAQLRISWAGEDLIYDVSMDWANSAFESWSWLLSGNYDPETDTLPLSGFTLMYTYREGGELDLEADQHEAEVNAVFAFDEDNILTCVSSDDESLNGLKFEYNPEYYGMWMWEF